MKKASIVFSILAFLVLMILVPSINRMDSSTIDLHFRDTYFVIGGWYFHAVALLVLLFAFCMIVCFVSKFNKQNYNFLLLLASIGILGFFGYLNRMA